MKMKTVEKIIKYQCERAERHCPVSCDHKHPHERNMGCGKANCDDMNHKDIKCKRLVYVYAPHL